jgi:hypothetical protein
MGRSTLIGPGRNTLTLAVLVFVWLSLSGLLLVSWGNPEVFLRRALGRYSRADTFEFLNGISVLFWLVHSALLLVGIAAARARRSDVVTVLLIGPAIAVIICLLNEDWSDPNWYVIVAVCTIGWLVSTIVGGVYWRLRPTKGRSELDLP